ncbi:LON peptidase N-terminal domain and RING finger protein 3 [Anabrus simplex]|uniref:LON peptidase N-terminal domain and RING finger protein 3 n=1 Tax=Anabrus simplex TaxID=316456 RepID=UPI0035A26573
MAEMARDAFCNRNYRLAAEMYERCLKERGPVLELFFGYGNSLARCGQLRQAIDVFSHCCRLGHVPLERMRHLTAALADAVVASCNPTLKTMDVSSSFTCGMCEGALVMPVTVPCGHTFCRKCVIKDASKMCCKCGFKLQSGQMETNILVKGLVEKWWGPEVESATLRQEGNELFRRNEEAAALAKFTEAVECAPDSAMALCSRSQLLYRLNRPQAALVDADAVVKLRPNWGKGHYWRGMALSGLGRYEDALVAFCMCVALERSSGLVRSELARTLHCLLLGPTLRTRCYSLGMPAPYSLGARLRVRTNPALNSSDCEDNSSGEEDCCQITFQRSPPLSIASLQENTKMHALLDKVFHEVNRIKRSESRGCEVLALPQQVSLADFECVLCCRVLWKPVTTPCGHTYCSMCLDRCLDYSFACPLCMTSLADYLATNQRNITEFVDRAIRILLPAEYASRQLVHYQELSVLGHGPHIPVFVCTTAFPTVTCPLYVYEPRYRVMVRRCVDSGNRQFGMAACVNLECGMKSYADFGTMLEIKDWVLLGDGCSILTTIGAHRFRVVARGERDGYDTAQVEFLRDQPLSSEHLLRVKELHERVHRKGWQWFSSMSTAVQMEIVSTFGEMPPIEDNWSELTDGPSWPWWLLAILPLGQHLKAGILGTTSLEKRLRAIDKTLNHIQEYTGNLPQVSSRNIHNSQQTASDSGNNAQRVVRRPQAARVSS